jgi:predicted DNA-binding transcriptional regulator AlpA
MDKKILKLTDIAQHLGVPVRTLYQMLKTERFPVAPIPGTKPRRWNFDDVETWRLQASSEKQKFSNEHKVERSKLSKEYRATVEGRSKTLFKSAKYRAAYKKISFTITQEFIQEIIENGFCQKSGIAFDLSPCDNSFRNPWAPSIDRILNNQGYDPENVQIVCNMYNTAKGEHTDGEVLKMCSAVVKHARL